MGEEGAPKTLPSRPTAEDLEQIVGYFVPSDVLEGTSSYSLAKVLQAVRPHLKAASLAGIVGGILCFALSYLVTPTYVTRLEFIPVESSTGPPSLLQGVLQGAGGLADLTGLSEFSSSASSKESIAILRSRAFATEFLVQNEIPSQLYPGSWNKPETSWKILGSGRPTLWDATNLFTRRVLSISEDRRTGAFSLSIRWTDPVAAATWANEFVKTADSKLRAEAKQQAEKSLKFLNEELAKTNIVPLQQAIYRLVELETNKVMLANVRDHYAFKIVDPAIPPDIDDYVWPSRVSFFLFGALAVAIVVLFGGVLFGARSAK